MAAVLAVTTVAALTATAPASAASASFTLDMIGGQGQVVLGKSPDAPLVLATPSTIKGTVDDQTGAITGGTLSTPPIQFTQQITTPVVADVDITATFSDTTPNSGTGNVDGLGNVSFSTSLDLDLHIEVGGGLITGDCASAPIVLNLISAAPYDPELGEVTLSDAAFAIPAAPTTPTCPAIIADAINDQLSSPSNSISLGLVGTLPLPPPPGDPSTTTLASSAPSTPLGHPVTFTATVEPADATGTVTFLSGTSSIGIASIGEGGIATLVTSSLPVGSHQITARYAGDLDRQPSVSPPLAHTVTAIPNLAADLPSYVVVGAAPTEFTATVTNPAAGGAQAGLRLDLLLGRVGTLTTLGATHLVLEHKVGSDWVPVTLARRTTPAPADPTGTLAGSYGGTAGFPLGAGESRQITFRISAAANAPQGIMAVQFKVNAVDAEGAVTTAFSTTTASIALTESARRTTTTAITAVTPEIRPGFAMYVAASVARSGATPLPAFAGGQVRVLIDGQPVEASTGLGQPYRIDNPVAAGGSTSFHLGRSATAGLAPGVHRISVHFLGDVIYQPSTAVESTFVVHSQPAVAYDCAFTLAVLPFDMGARVTLYSPDMPTTAAPGTTVTLKEIEMVAITQHNGNAPYNTSVVEEFINVLPGTPEGENAVRFLDFSPEGSTGTFDWMTTGPIAVTGPSERSMSYEDNEVTFTVEGEPGDVVDVKLERFGTELDLSGIAVSFVCTPVDEAASLGSVVVAGTSLSSSAVGPVEEGSAVTLSASVFPSSAQGMVEFFDGATSLGFAPVSAGTAVLPTTALPQGRRSVSARYMGDLVNAPSTSEAVEVVVRDVILCKNQTGTESGSTVRATYLSLLGRCAEPSGFAFWRGRLDGGLSAEVFAGQIANTLEAHGRSVDDGYRLVLGRNADSAGRGFWAQRLNAGQRYDSLLGDLAASPEFWVASGSTNSGFVTRLYDRLLHRAPDASGLSYWVGRLNAGQSRASVAASFVRLPEPSGQIVVGAYEAILDRAPTGAEKAPAVAAFQGSGHRWKVYAGLIGTTEFHDRAQGHPNS